MQVIKILNNNALLALDADGMEYVYLANGIGFGNKVNQPFKSVEGQRRYQLSAPKKAEEIVERVDVAYIELSAKILSLVQQKFPGADENILLPLADHIAFAVQRIRSQMEIVNPFAKDIPLLFPDEYEIAKQGAALVAQEMEVDINADEISYITLHIHSAISAEHVQLTLQVVGTIQTFVSQMEESYHITINYDSIAYTRFVTHIKFMMARMYHKEKLGIDMNGYAKENFPFSYEKAEELARILEEIMKMPIQEIETGYLALHIERVIQATIANEDA